MSDQEKAKAAVEWLEYVNTNTKAKFDAKFHALSIIRLLAAGTHVMVKLPEQLTNDELAFMANHLGWDIKTGTWDLAMVKTHFKNMLGAYEAMIPASQEQE